MDGPGFSRRRPVRRSRSRPPGRAAKHAVCNPEQRARRSFRTIASMFRDHAKTAILSGWILGLGTMTWASTLVSSGGSTLLLAWGLLPPLLLIRMRNSTRRTNPAIAGTPE